MMFKVRYKALLLQMSVLRSYQIAGVGQKIHIMGIVFHFMCHWKGFSTVPLKLDVLLVCTDWVHDLTSDQK
jgi:hypothetical protein